MGTGNAAGFGGAFTSALAQSLMASQQSKQQQQARQQQNAIQGLNFLINSGQVGDIADLEPMLGTAFPDLFGEQATKARGKNKSGFDGAGMVKTILSQALQGGGSPMLPGPAAAMTPGAPARGPEDVGPVPVSGEGAALGARPLPSGSPSPGTAARRTLGGIPLLSPDEIVQRGVDKTIRTDEATINAKVGLARKLLPTFQAIDPKFTIENALKVVGLDPTTYAQRAQTVPQVGTFGDQLLRKQRELGRDLTTDEVETLRSEYSVQRFGQERESAAMRLFGQAYGLLTPEQQQEADTAAKTSIQGTAAARTQGAGEGKMNAPADLSTAQRTGVAVGTTANDVLGQAVPTKEQNEIRTAATQLTEQLNNIKTNLLTVLPSDKDLIGGLLPGAVLEVRKRDPRYRAQVAQLDSAMQLLVNNVARVVAGAKGAQSEKDAQRAEAAVLSLNQGWTKGDTRESAEARINETLKAIETVLATVPGKPVVDKPTTPVAAKPAAAKPAGTAGAVPGYTMKNGILHGPDGKPVE